MKIAIIGSGAMGCLYGAYLSKKNKVIMVDVVDKVVDTICEKGITIKENDGSEHHYKENILILLSLVLISSICGIILNLLV